MFFGGEGVGGVGAFAAFMGGWGHFFGGLERGFGEVDGGMFQVEGKKIICLPCISVLCWLGVSGG